MMTLEVFQIDDESRLFISPAIQEWTPLQPYKIDTVIDLEGGLDECIPSAPNGCLYVYFPIYDEQLPDLQKLEAVVALGSHLVASGHRVLSHCGMGFNRSALIAGRILHRLGMPGERVVEQIRARRPGALFNEVFAEHLRTLR